VRLRDLLSQSAEAPSAPDPDEHHGPDTIDGIFVDVATAQQVPPSWVIRDLIPPGLVFLAGPPKCGKSTVTAAVAALVAEYECKALPPHLSETLKHGPVLWFSAEADAGVIHHMMEDGLGVPPMEPREAILVAKSAWEWRLDDEDALDRLMTWLRRRDPRLVIIDPLRDFHKGEERDSGSMNRLLRPIREWAINHDSAVIIVHHTKKQSDDMRGENLTALDMRGTTALFGIADAVLMLTPKQSGATHIEATFKRAAGWSREVTLATYGTKTAVDHIGDLETQVSVLMASGVTDLSELAERLHVGMAAIIGALNKTAVAATAAKKGQSWTTRK
jgi:hypothetical protein